MWNASIGCPMIVDGATQSSLGTQFFYRRKAGSMQGSNLAKAQNMWAHHIKNIEALILTPHEDQVTLDPLRSRKTQWGNVKAEDWKWLNKPVDGHRSDTIQMLRNTADFFAPEVVEAPQGSEQSSAEPSEE